MVVAIEKHFLQDRLIDGSEFLFTLKDLSIISKIIMEESGIVLSESKASLVYSRLAKRIRHLGLSSFSEYCSLIQGDFGKDEKQELIAALTTNVTRFFREQHHFEHMQKNILPNLIREAKARRRIRIWSAACSSGPEPYSIALTILQAMPNAGDYDIRILATDIDHNILKIASSGIYDASQLAPISEEMQRRWFRPLNDGLGKMQVKPELRNLITFKQLNLIGSWPMKGKFQAIFCRNVVIYFDSKTQESVWSRFLPLMEDGGALYIGHSERVSGPSEKYFLNDGTTIYRNRMEGR